MEIPNNSSPKIPILSSSSIDEVTPAPKISPSNHDECSGCKKDFGSATDELEHCPHCGQAVCPVCKGEHKMMVLEKLHASRARIQEKMDDMCFSQQYKKETIAQLKLQGDVFGYTVTWCWNFVNLIRLRCLDSVHRTRHYIWQIGFS